MTYNPVSTELTVLFSSSTEALKFKGRNKIEVDISDLGGASNSYSATVSVYLGSERAVIDEDKYGNKGQGGQGDLKK
jgi:hypothetical protein